MATAIGTTLNDGGSGIYAILNSIDGRIYVGSSINLGKRTRDHCMALRAGWHKNSYLQNAFRKHGERNFSFHVLEHCDKDILVKSEQFWMDLFSTAERYNLSPTAGTTLGFRHSGEVRSRMSASKTGPRHYFWGKKFSPEHIKKLSESHIGQKATKETRLKMSMARKGKILTNEQRMKISKALTGKPLSEEHKAKLSMSKLGVTRNGEFRKSLSARMTGTGNPFYGKSHSIATKSKLSKLLQGRKLSKETRARMALSQTKRRSERR